MARQQSFSWNPLWPHYLSVAALAFSLLVGLARFLLWDSADPMYCRAMLNEGSWLDRAYAIWQPDGCMLHAYNPKDAALCLASQRVVFIGDSVTRKLYFQFANLIDPTLPTAPPDDDAKHADHTLQSKEGTFLSFVWDPFLNTSTTHNFINSLDASGAPPRTSAPPRPALLVLGAGLWYLRYANASGGLSAWEGQMETVTSAISRGGMLPADEIVILPVEEVVPSMLSPDRAASMRLSDIDAMNSDLYHRLTDPGDGSWQPFAPPRPRSHISLPFAFNQMLDSSQTEDGLHFSDAVVKMQANILLNLRCNEVLPKQFPLDTTCCRVYPWPTAVHWLLLLAVFLWGPTTWYLSRNQGWVPLQYYAELTPPLIISISLALIYAADRTGLWQKEHKQFDPWTFGFLNLFALAVGLLTLKSADKDLGFLNREQTDEWKGWMQIAILIYHYYGASKVHGIYNPIRVLVASYLFMTGYGHTTFYVKKADFGFLRVAQVLVRLNIYTLLLAYVMNTDYITYYFSPLVSMWYLIIYGTMAIGSRFNDRTPILVAKILASMALVGWFMSEPSLLESVFEALDRFCGIRWSAREWAFRVNLDLWIVYFGMFTALATIKIREHRLTDHPYWQAAVKLSIGLAAVTMLWFFAFELVQPTKFVYNTWHPYVAFLPVGAFVVLRNATPILRGAHSRAFAFVGTCSLETFIIQYHFWLAGDTKGILLVLPGTRWRPLNMVITSIAFLYISHRVAEASGELTAWICGSARKSLPTTADAPLPAAGSRRDTQAAPSRREEIIPLVEENGRKSDMEHDRPVEPDTPARPVSRGWADRLAASSSRPSSEGLRLWYGDSEWTPGVKTKLAIGVAFMWILNIIWPIP